MEYGEKYSVPSQTATLMSVPGVARGLRQLAARARYDVKLLLGDADIVVIDDFRAVLQENLGPSAQDRVTDPIIGSVDELLSQLGATDFVVATRFHNVLMSLLLGKPPIAISFHHKVSSLMSEMGLSEYCHDINEMNADALIAQFQALVRNAEDAEAGDRASRRGNPSWPSTSSTRSSSETQSTSRTRRSDRCVVTSLAPHARRSARAEVEAPWDEDSRGLCSTRIGGSGSVFRHACAIWSGAQTYGRWLHALTLRNAAREMYVGTLFLRNRPALDLMRRSYRGKAAGIDDQNRCARL